MRSDWTITLNLSQSMRDEVFRCVVASSDEVSSLVMACRAIT